MKCNAAIVWCGSVMVAAASILVIGSNHLASAQEPKPAANGDEAQENDNKRLLAQMRKLADTVLVAARDGEESKDVALIPKPLLRFSDQKRFISDGTLWAWGTAGRPLLMAEFHTGERLKPRWGNWLVATSDVPVLAVIGGQGRWTPRVTDFKLLPILDIGAPANSDSGRLRQMKRFARSLSGSSQWQGQQFELRLLPTEVHRYSDAASGLVDGAVFVFAVDSNPEAILFVEAHEGDSGPGAAALWKYALAQMSAASLTFRRGDTEVWAVPRSSYSRNAVHLSFERTLPDTFDYSE
jgi:hypothetical protein